MLWLCAFPMASDSPGGHRRDPTPPARRVLWVHARPLPARERVSETAGKRAGSCSEWRWGECDASHGMTGGRGIC